MIWAAMHDIVHGERDCTLEYAVLILCVPAFAVLYGMALRFLAPKAKLAWLGGTAVLVLLFNLAALNARLHPKYAPDAALSSLFLTAGLPVLGLICCHLVREALRLRARR
ncbi:MAG: hypothetical protein M1436_04875 [Acidobacteria bacterium]|nr:hypothetical protein [Acidobacteriota bacterium]